VGWSRIGGDAAHPGKQRSDRRRVADVSRHRTRISARVANDRVGLAGVRCMVHRHDEAVTGEPLGPGDRRLAGHCGGDCIWLVAQSILTPLFKLTPNHALSQFCR
jgi:hypothetical protein